MTRNHAHTSRRGFTLIEITVTVIIITMLTGLALVMANRAIRGSRRSSERLLLQQLNKSITAFKNEFGFLPPLVDDANPINGGQPSNIGNTPAGLAYLQGFTSPNPGATIISPDKRYSINSLSFYLMGLCNFPVAPGNKPMDGADGSQFTQPKADGTFTRKGKAYDSFYDASNQFKRIGTGYTVAPVSPANTISFNDRWGGPIRYYRWEPRQALPNASAGSADAKTRTLIPFAVGDPLTNPKLRSARYALISGGEKGTIPDGAPTEVGNTAAAGTPLESDDGAIVEVEE